MDEISIASPTLYAILNWGIVGGGSLIAIYVWQWHRCNPPNRERCTETLASRAWSPLQVAILLLSTVGLYLLLSFLCALIFSRDLSPLLQLAIMVATYIAGISIMQAILVRRAASWRAAFGMGLRQMKLIRLAPTIYLATIPFVLIVTSAYHYMLQHWLGLEITNQYVVDMVAKETSWIEIAYTAAAIIGAPIYEELVFRGILFPYVLKRFGVAGGVMVVSAVFALIHFHLPSFASLFMLSAILCLAYWRFGSIWLCIGIHAIFNGITTLALKLIY